MLVWTNAADAGARGFLEQHERAGHVGVDEILAAVGDDVRLVQRRRVQHRAHARLIASRTKPRSPIVPTASVNGEGLRSSPRASSPRARSRRISASPRWPALPVTRTVMAPDSAVARREQIPARRSRATPSAIDFDESVPQTLARSALQPAAPRPIFLDEDRSPGPRGGAAKQRTTSTYDTFPLLPLRDIVVFPGMVVPLFVGRDKSVAALEAAMEGDKDIFLLAQLDPGCDDPDRDDLYDVGVVAQVLQLLKLPDGTVRVLVEGQHARAARERCAKAATATCRRARSSWSSSRHRRGQRSRGDDALGGRAVRRIRQAQQEAARGRRATSSPRSTTPASWPTRSPPRSPPRSPTSRRC